ncbi:hypothetical protein LZ30DRAFT_738184 [Colletotrichum cereale]|nr:hypothetical protein LZ30DRAFT_738184 [Colletotrichum cereale]
MDRYPCINRYKHGVDCPIWVNVHGARCEDCVVMPSDHTIRSFRHLKLRGDSI